MIPNFIKVKAARIALSRVKANLKDVNKGTTIVGSLLTVLLASQFVDLGKLLGFDGQTSAILEWVKVAVVFGIWLIFFLIGKPIDIATVLETESKAVDQLSKGPDQEK